MKEAGVEGGVLKPPMIVRAGNPESKVRTIVPGSGQHFNLSD